MRRRRILGPDGRPIRRRVRAKYDAAQTTTDNLKHWALADGLSADSANSAAVRQKLRNRARYEVANSPYLHGIIQTLANDTISVGPTLQVLTANKSVNDWIESEFRRWFKAIKGPRKLRTMRKARAVAGEAFGLMVTNTRLDTPVQLDLKLVEADQVSTPNLVAVSGSDNAIDGIVFDQNGEPTFYHLLKHHPGSTWINAVGDYDEIPAHRMIHMFRQDRPGQHRGIPEITPSLALWAMLRRFDLATLAAAETAAEMAAVLESSLPPDDDDESTDREDTEGEYDATAGVVWDTIELERNMATVLPDGYKLNQYKPEHPGTTHHEYMRDMVNQGAAPVSMPINIAMRNSSEHNYASGRLDHQTYDMALAVDRSEIGADTLDPLVMAWLQEAVLIPDYAPDVLKMMVSIGLDITCRYFWRPRGHVDPVKEALAEKHRLANGSTNLAEIGGVDGVDWEEREATRFRVRQVQLENDLKLAEIEAKIAKLRNPAPEEATP